MYDVGRYANLGALRRANYSTPNGEYVIRQIYYRVNPNGVTLKILQDS